MFPISCEKLIASYKLDGNAQDESGNNLHGVEENISWVDGRHGAPKSAAYFDGITSNIRVDGIDFSSSSFSISVWARRDAGNHVATDVILGQSGMQFGFQWGGMNAIFGLTWNGSDLYLPSSGFDNFDLGSWHHYVGTYDASTWRRRIFRDGKPMSEDRAPRIRAKGTLYIGTSPLGGNRAFPGAIDEVLVFSRVLAEEEIRSLFEQRPQPIHYDQNNNGLPDTLDVKLQKAGFDNQTSTNDPDQDGLTNEWEILLGTDPLDGQSVFKFAFLRTNTGNKESSKAHLTLTFPSVVGLKYIVQHQEKMGANWIQVGAPWCGNNEDLSVLVEIDQSHSGFYRIKIVKTLGE